MPEQDSIKPAAHKKQIEAYRKEYPAYKLYAEVLRRVFEKACKVSFPEALVQSRPKAVSSFAEKVVRKFKTYPDAVNQMTDLCGARVIVQTNEQVKAVCRFIDKNFHWLEREDKGLLLSEDKFGYRDMHYIITLDKSRAGVLGISDGELKTICARRAEVQVRTWVQHAWADTLHDRMYKNKLQISSDIKRRGALLAAILEEGDRSFDYLADELDGLIANYTAFADKDDVLKEINVQELILANEPDKNKVPGLKIKIAKLRSACGDYAKAVELLESHVDILDANRCELLTDLGYNICRLHRKAPLSKAYAGGRKLMLEALGICESGEMPFVPHLRKNESRHARILSRLGWAWEVVKGEESKARDFRRRAHEHEPANPYYLADMLGFELFCTRSSESPVTMLTTIREAIKTCRGHALAGLELPYSYFTAGRLSLLLEKIEENKAYGSLNYYARGIRHFLAGKYCVPDDVLSVERDWIKNICFSEEPPMNYQYVLKLLGLGEAAAKKTRMSGAKMALVPPLLIIAGGASGMDRETLKNIRPLIKAGLDDFKGTVIAGGTTAGVPGLAGDAAGKLKSENKKHFKLVRYRPEKLPDEVTMHKDYDQTVKIGNDFLPDQILQNWTDLLAAGIEPKDVRLVGFGGGVLSAVEYAIALGLGASVGIVEGTGEAADRFLKDPLWKSLSNFYALPLDAMTIRAFTIMNDLPGKQARFEKAAEKAHEEYVRSAIPEETSLSKWKGLPEDLKISCYHQISYAENILKTAGLGLRPVTSPKKPLFDMGKSIGMNGIRLLAEMEHGRWNAERLIQGWHYSPVKDVSKKQSPFLAPWNMIPKHIQENDIDAIRSLPATFKEIGLEIYKA